MSVFLTVNVYKPTMLSGERENSLNFHITEGEMGHQKVTETEFCSAWVIVLAGHLADGCLAP